MDKYETRFEDLDLDKKKLIGKVNNKPLCLGLAWIVLSVFLLYFGITSNSMRILLILIGVLNLTCACYMLLKVEAFVAIRVYSDCLVLTNTENNDNAYVIYNDDIVNWQIDKSEGTSIDFMLIDNQMFKYPIVQTNKIYNLLFKTIGKKEKSEIELNEFKKKNDDSFFGISDIKKVIRKKIKKNEQD